MYVVIVILGGLIQNVSVYASKGKAVEAGKQTALDRDLDLHEDQVLVWDTKQDEGVWSMGGWA